MAYAALTCLVEVIDRNLEQDEKSASICIKDQMISLLKNVSLLQQFLENISSKSFLPEDIDVFESRIRDIAYKMEDTIELVILTEPGEESESDVQIPTPDDFASCFEDVQMLVEEAMEMKRNIDNDANMETLHPLTAANDANLETLHPLTAATSSRAYMGIPSSTTRVGLGHALGQIYGQLILGRDSVLRIISITGMGGIGKTTLARVAYEAPQIRHHFDLRLWVTVSQEYSIQDILRRLLPEEERSKRPDEQLIEYVYKHLKGRRYLIVLDDMWEKRVWDRVRNAFPDDHNRSRVILTTRLSGVATYVGSYVHKMQFLNEDQSWDLLRENVYGHEHRSTEFEGIGRKIAKNCKGLPLALVVIAGLLKFNKTIDYWKQVAQNTNQKAIKDDDHLFEILCWSYSRLPPHLKACFLYMGTYKEDYEIPMKELVRLWAAEGFLKPKANRAIEEVAEECLQELVERSLVLVTKRWYNGKIRTCSVHDALREVSIRKAENEKFHYHIMSPVKSVGGVLADQRRVSVTNCYQHSFCLPRDTFFVTTHSLIDQSIYGSVSMSIVERFKLLRVLNKVCIEESQFRILCKQTNLRYLHFIYHESGAQIRVIQSIYKLQNLETLIVSDPPIIVPESTSKPQNLETFVVRGQWEPLIFFPREIWELQRLRHIVMLGKRSGLQVPLPNQDCPSLQTLYGVMDLNITRSLSERIPNLKILKLIYTYLIQQYSMESLQYLDQLEVLCIRSMYLTKLTNFVFPQNLRKLTLFGTHIPWENLSPTIGSLRELKVLKLKSESVSGKEWEPIEGEFLQLQHLKMENLHIRHWIADSIHFPSLQKLVILDCLYFEEVPESTGEIDTLEMLIVRTNKESLRRSVEHIKQIQQELGNPLLEVIILKPKLGLPHFWRI